MSMADAEMLAVVAHNYIDRGGAGQVFHRMKVITPYIDLCIAQAVRRDHADFINGVAIAIESLNTEPETHHAWEWHELAAAKEAWDNGDLKRPFDPTEQDPT